MNEIAPPPPLTASKIWGRGMSLRSRFRQPKSWFLVRDEWLVRCTGPEDSDAYSKKVLAGKGAGNKYYWEREYFGIILAPWSAVTILQKGLVCRVSDSPNYLSITQWLNHCATCHPKCRPQRSLDLESITLIDVHTRKLVHYPRSEAGSQDCEYIALSYVWGNAIQHSVQKTASLPKLLPRTIQDALTVVDRIGKRYLWIDSICIDQSKPVEKMSQISIMDQIYQGAFATIIALSGESADSGIPGVQSWPKRIPQMYADFGKIHMASRMPDLEEELRRSTWMTRAWTYQEALLSRRCIIFTKHQVFFSCNESDCSEVEGRSKDPKGNDFLTPNSKLHPLRDPLVSFEDWSVSAREKAKIGIYNYFISDYTRRNMTKDSDSLNAITALLKQMENTIFPKGFIFGLPVEIFRHALLWIQNFEGSQKAARRRTEGEFPSWSWVAWHFDDGIQVRSNDKSNGSLQPPLGVVGRESVNALVKWDDGAFSKSPDLVDCTQEVKQIIAHIRNIYLCSKSQVEQIGFKRDLSFQKEDGLKEIDIEGFLLKLPVKITDAVESLHKESLYSKYGGPLAPRLCVAEAFWPGSDPLPFTAKWHLDRDYRDLAPYHETQYHSFLLVSVEMTNEEEIMVDLILLSWEGEVAVRGGVVRVPMNWRSFEIFWNWAQPKRSRFRFR